MEDLCFFITRHVRNEEQNFSWNECVKQIREFYKNESIFIIDDNSNQEELKQLYNFENVEKIFIINNQDEYKGKGEILSYYYYYKINPAKKMIFIHDNSFLLHKIDYDDIKDFKFLWSFNQDFINENNNHNDFSTICDFTNGNKIVEYLKENSKGIGCFGCQGIITYEYLDYLQKTYNFFQLFEKINNRHSRIMFERILGALMTYEKKTSLFGDWYEYMDKYDIRYKNLMYYLINKDKLKNNGLPLYKFGYSR
jgi:hypothetical protein